MTVNFDIAENLKSRITKPSAASQPKLVVAYGRAGGGKTWFAGSASELPHVKRVLYLDSEGSTTGTLTGFDDDKIDIVRVEAIKDFDAILGMLLHPEAVNPYDVVVIDTVDVLQEMKVKEFKAKYDGYRVWEEVGDWTRNLFRELRKKDFMTIALFHEKETTDDSGKTSVRLKLQGGAKDDVPGIPDTVIYLERKLAVIKEGEEPGEHTFGYFASDDNKVTKNRFGFPSHMLDPSFAKMFKHIEDNKKETK